MSLARAASGCLLAVVLAAGCGGDRAGDGRGDIPDVPVRAVDEDGQVTLTPAESAAAVRSVAEHSRRVHEEARRAAGLPEEEPPAPSAPAAPGGPPAPSGYADCMEQAAGVSGEEERAMLERVCLRLPGAP